MKFLKHATIAGGALALATATLVAQQINGAGATFPQPDLLQVVLRVQQAASRRADQLSVDRFGRRHSADHGADRVLRRHRRPDDAGTVASARLAEVLHFPTVLGADVPVYNIPGVTAS